MPRFMRGIHVLLFGAKTWMARTSRAMTTNSWNHAPQMKKGAVRTRRPFQFLWGALFGQITPKVIMPT